MDKDELKSVLTETLNQCFQQSVTFTSSLWYDALFGITLDETNTYIFSLQGCAGDHEEQTTGWERFSFKESSYIKTQLEDGLSIKIFEMLPKAGVAAVEGTVSVVIDNSQVILFHVDKTISAETVQSSNSNILQEESNASTSTHTEMPTSRIDLEGEEIIEKLQDLIEGTPILNSGQPKYSVIDEIGKKARKSRSKVTHKSKIKQQKIETTKKKGRRGKKNVSKKASQEKMDDSESDIVNTHENDSERVGRSEIFIVNTVLVDDNDECDSLENSDAIDNENEKDSDIGLNNISPTSGEQMTPETPNLNDEINENNDNNKSRIVKKQRSRAHSKQSLFTCDACDEIFPTESSLKDHQRSHIQIQYSCPICDKLFDSTKDLNRHKKQHLKERKFACEVCGHCFYRKGDLKYHINTHTGLKPFECKICNRKLTRKSTLNYHMLSHQGNQAKNFCCDECGKKFRMLAHLQRHKITHLDLLNRPYQCDACPKTFVNKGKLDNHKRVHTGVKPFVCEFCHKAFADWGNMSAHRKIHTGQQVKRIRKRKKKENNLQISEENDLLRNFSQEETNDDNAAFNEFQKMLETQDDLNKTDLEDIEFNVTVNVQKFNEDSIKMNDQ